MVIATLGECVLVAVLDGTVGDFASDTVKDLLVPNLIASQGWKDFEADPHATESVTSERIERALREMYAVSDKQLIQLCAEAGHHYASSTAVVCLLVGDLFFTSHIGDSRACLVGEHQAVFLTQDHRPESPSERNRIEANGGSVVYLSSHHSRPFIRGGDFNARKLAGDQPMQLQYSRAFGGKDLKPYGLSAEPDISVMNTGMFRCVILASDGLWDDLAAGQAAQLVRTCPHTDSPAERLVRTVLANQSEANIPSDNITAIVLTF